MTMRFDAETERFIESYKRGRDAKRRLIMQMLQAMGLDVENWREADMLAKEIRAMGQDREGE